MGEHRIRVAERAFTFEEREWLSRLLCANLPGRQILLEQVEAAKVIGACDCGCRTVDIRVDRSCGKYPSPARVPVEMSATMPDGVPIVFSLHVVEGYISELEVLRADSKPIIGEVNLAGAVINVSKGFGPAAK